MRISLERAKRYAAENPLAVAFMALAILTRLSFWLYTGRVWEDALITLAPARNAWLGYGLTHHLSEPRVHSFTSPISVLIPLVGEAFHQGLLLLRMTALIGGAVSVYYAYNLGKLFKFHWAAQVLILGYLATDQLQIFFGMAGMETQVATAIFLATAFYLFTERWVLFGIAAGLGMLARPEFVFCIGIFGLYMLIWHPRQIIKAVPPFLLVVLPWYLFAQLYYGSVIPNTIIAKSVGGRFGPFKFPLSVAWSYFKTSWLNIAPFKEWFFAVATPVPMQLLKAVVALVVAFALFGAVSAVIKRDKRLIALLLITIIFIFYRTVSELSTYYMWYIPPFAAFLFLIAAYGVSEIAKKRQVIASTLAIFVACMYAIHIPFSFAVEKKVQQKIECGVRFKAGVIVNSMMGPSDTVVMEPLGYIGYGAFNRTTYDFPGLSSKIVVSHVGHMKDYWMISLIPELHPSFAILRPGEVKSLQEMYPETARNYIKVADISADSDTDLSQWGYVNGNLAGDGYFSILKRISPPTELGDQPAPQPDSTAADIYGVCKR